MNNNKTASADIVWLNSIANKAQTLLGLTNHHSKEFANECQRDVREQRSCDQHGKEAILLGVRTCCAITKSGTLCSYKVGYNDKFCKRHSEPSQRNGEVFASSNDGIPDIRSSIGTLLFSGIGSAFTKADL